MSDGTLSPTTPHQNDVLIRDQSHAYQSASGNIQLRELARQECKMYDESSPKGKYHISCKLVEIVRRMNPPGRFLKKNDSGLWKDVGDKVAREKVSEELRNAIATFYTNPSLDQVLSIGNFQIVGNELLVTAPMPTCELQRRMAECEGSGQNNEVKSSEAASLSKEPKMPSAVQRNGLCGSQGHAQQQPQVENNGDGVDDDETTSDAVRFGRVGASSLTEQLLGVAQVDSKQPAKKTIRTSTSKRSLKRKATAMKAGNATERNGHQESTNSSCVPGTNLPESLQIQLLNAELSKIKVQLTKAQEKLQQESRKRMKLEKRNARQRLELAKMMTKVAQPETRVSDAYDLIQQLSRKCKELEERNSRLCEEMTINMSQRQARVEAIACQTVADEEEAVKIAWRDLTEYQWDIMYRELVAFKKKHGHTNVPNDASCKVLHFWLRQQIEKNQIQTSTSDVTPLSEDQFRKLDELGVYWGRPTYNCAGKQILLDTHTENEYCDLQSNLSKNRESA